jgi:hypothetical protein
MNKIFLSRCFAEFPLLKKRTFSKVFGSEKIKETSKKSKAELGKTVCITSAQGAAGLIKSKGIFTHAQKQRTSLTQEWREKFQHANKMVRSLAKTKKCTQENGAAYA